MNNLKKPLSPTKRLMLEHGTWKGRQGHKGLKGPKMTPEQIETVLGGEQIPARKGNGINGTHGTHGTHGIHGGGK